MSKFTSAFKTNHSYIQGVIVAEIFVLNKWFQLSFHKILKNPVYRAVTI